MRFSSLPRFLGVIGNRRVDGDHQLIVVAAGGCAALLGIFGKQASIPIYRLRVRQVAQLKRKPIGISYTRESRFRDQQRTLRQRTGAGPELGLIVSTRPWHLSRGFIGR